MIRVAWLTNKDVKGGQGGAEASDRDMLRHRPEGVEVTLVRTGGVLDGRLDNFDYIVAAGLWGFTSRELNALKAMGFTYWVHDTQLAGHWIYEDATNLIFLTPGHGEFELSKNPLIQKPKIFYNPGWMDTSKCFSAAKQEYALWASRPDPNKGLDLATKWAADKGIELKVLTSVTRDQVLGAMAEAKYFVLMPHLYDAGPRSIMEAQLCGCEIVVNENVGMWDEPWNDLQARITRAPEEFWNVVLG